MITLLLARLLSIPCQMPAIDTAGIVLIFVEVTFFVIKAKKNGLMGRRV